MFIYQEYSKTVNIEDKVIIRDVVQECQANEDVIYSYDNSPIRIPYALTTEYYYDDCYFVILLSLQITFFCCTGKMIERTMTKLDEFIKT